jgi:(2Fe-2S) ferredoxin
LTTLPRVRVCRDCCCGTAHKHPDVDHDALFDRLTRATGGAAVVDVSGCLLACEKSNVVVVQPSATARLRGARPVWLREVLDIGTVDAIAAWVRAGGPGVCEVPSTLTELVTTPGVLGEAVL